MVQPRARRTSHGGEARVLAAQQPRPAPVMDDAAVKHVLRTHHTGTYVCAGQHAEAAWAIVQEDGRAQAGATCSHAHTTLRHHQQDPSPCSSRAAAAAPPHSLSTCRQPRHTGGHLSPGPCPWRAAGWSRYPACASGGPPCRARNEPWRPAGGSWRFGGWAVGWGGWFVGGLGIRV